MTDTSAQLHARITDDLARLNESVAAVLDLSAAIPPALAAPAPAPVAVIANDDDVASHFADYGSFYDFLRGNALLGPKITKSEYDGCHAIIGACLKQHWGVSYTAYAMATAYLETNHTMQPIKELGGPSYFFRMYDIKGNRPDVATTLGNLTPGDGAKFPGHGYVQLTGRKNYVKATAKLRALGLDVDLVANPEDAMRPEIAAMIMVLGMQEGWFTTRKLSDDLPLVGPATIPQFVASRDIINGKDRQADVANYAFQLQTGLIQAGYRQAA